MSVSYRQAVPCSQLTVSCPHLGQLTFWDVVESHPIRILDGSPSGPVNTLDISPDGVAFVSGGTDRLVKVTACT